MRAYVVALTAVAALAVSASPAAAEGFRAEVHAGLDHDRVSGESDSGVLYGVGIGYDFNIGSNAFVGVEANLDDSTQKECENDVVALDDRLCLKAGRDLSAGVRVGFNVTERGKLYALGAYTNGRYKAVYRNAAGTTTSDAANLDGFRLGAGYQHQVGSSTYAKVEYRYSNYEAGVERHQALVGFGVTF